MPESNGPIKPTHLTVLLRNDGPLMFVGDTPSYRRVTVELTAEQREKLALQSIGMSGGVTHHESYSHAFLEGATDD